jgi:hypothetical protein
VIRTVIRHGALLGHRPGELIHPGRDRRFPQDSWMPIEYPQAVWNQFDCWISNAEVAGIQDTAFTLKPKSEQVTARRVRARNEKAA